jgi:hypothetical protein
MGLVSRLLATPFQSGLDRSDAKKAAGQSMPLTYLGMCSPFSGAVVDPLIVTVLVPVFVVCLLSAVPAELMMPMSPLGFNCHFFNGGQTWPGEKHGSCAAGPGDRKKQADRSGEEQQIS